MQSKKKTKRKLYFAREQNYDYECKKKMINKVVMLLYEKYFSFIFSTYFNE